MGNIIFDRKNYAGTIDALSNLRSRDANDTAMPSLTRYHRHIRICPILSTRFQFLDRQLHDLALDFLSLPVASIEVLGQSQRFCTFTSIEKFDDGARRVHPSGCVYPWPNAKAYVVCSHAAAISAAANLHQRAQPWVRRFHKIVETERDDSSIFSSQLRDIGDRSNGDDF